MPTIANKRTRFNLTTHHLMLLKHAYIGWDSCEFGAPEINPKRPYGNSNVCDDIRELLCILLTNEEATTLHRGTKQALEIVLQTQQFKTGVYELQRVENSLSMYVWQYISDEINEEDGHYSASNGKVYILRRNLENLDVTDVYDAKENRIGGILQSGSVWDARNLYASTVASSCIESETALDALIAWHDRHHGQG